MDSSGEEDTSLVIIEHLEETVHLHPKAETSEQMDKKSEDTEKIEFIKSSPKEDCVKEENSGKANVPWHFSSSLFLVVVDYINGIFSGVPESTDYIELAEDAASYVGSESAELQPSPIVVNEGDDMIPEPATDLLSQDLDPISSTSQPSEEATAATAFEPFFGEPGLRPVEASITRGKDKTIASEKLVWNTKQPKIEMLASIPEIAEDEDTEDKQEKAEAKTN